MATKENTPNWSEAEGLLLLDLFMKLGGQGVSADTKEIRELSELLNSPGFRPPGAPDTYRNPIGVAMQYGCLTSLDGSGRAGFKPSKLLVRLWNHYQGKEGELAERAATLRAVTAGETHAWMFYMASDERRSWQSNRGYDDAPGKYYSYDSNVRRAAQVKAGDIAVIRHDDYVVGTEWLTKSAVGLTKSGSDAVPNALPPTGTHDRPSRLLFVAQNANTSSLSQTGPSKRSRPTRRRMRRHGANSRKRFLTRISMKHNS